jgi:predicted ATPase
MLTSITLQGFKCFGEAQTIPLRQVTVLCGANNAGKSCFMSLGRLVRRAVRDGGDAAIEREGGARALFYRPAQSDPSLRIAWRSDEGSYATVLAASGSKVIQQDERLEHTERGSAWRWGPAPDASGAKDMKPPSTTVPSSSRRKPPLGTPPFAGLRAVIANDSRDLRPFHRVWAPLVCSRDVNLAVASIRQDAEVVPSPRLSGSGAGLAAVLGLWRGAYPDRAEQLHAAVRRCFPEIRHILVRPSPEPALQRLWVEQADGERFDAANLSDGVLCFIALVVHALDAEPQSVLFIEEPERAIHPDHLGALVDVFRRAARERCCQIVLASRSPAVIGAFRGDPESLVLLRRGERGVQALPLSEHAELLSEIAPA